MRKHARRFSQLSTLELKQTYRSAQVLALWTTVVDGGECRIDKNGNQRFNELPNNPISCGTLTTLGITHSASFFAMALKENCGDFSAKPLVLPWRTYPN
jgi:hypothetical protein